MNVSILRRGKEEIYEFNGIEILFELFNGNFKDDEQLILNTLQCISNVAEEPRARKLLRTGKYLEIIKNFNKHEDDLIKEQSKLAEESILWEP